MTELISKNKKDIGIVNDIRTSTIDDLNHFSMYDDTNGDTGYEWYYYKIPIQDGDDIYDDYNNFLITFFLDDNYNYAVFAKCQIGYGYEDINDVFVNKSYENLNDLKHDNEINISHNSKNKTKHCFILFRLMEDIDFDITEAFDHIEYKYYVNTLYDNILTENPLSEESVTIGGDDEDREYSTASTYEDEEENVWKYFKFDGGDKNELNRFSVNFLFDGSGNFKCKFSATNDDTEAIEDIFSSADETYEDIASEDEKFFSYNGSDRYVYIFLMETEDVSNVYININYILGENTYKGHLLCFHDYGGHRIYFRLLFPKDYSPSDEVEYSLLCYCPGGMGDSIYSCLEPTSLTRKLFMHKSRYEDYKCFGITVPGGSDTHIFYSKNMYYCGESDHLNTSLLSLLKKFSNYSSIDINRFYYNGFSAGFVKWFGLVNQTREIWAGSIVSSAFADDGYKTEKEKYILSTEVSRYKHIPLMLTSGHFTDGYNESTLRVVKELDIQNGNYHYQRYSSVGGMLKEWYEDKDERFIEGDGNKIFFNFSTSDYDYGDGGTVLEEGVTYSIQGFVDKINEDFKNNTGHDFNIADVVSWEKYPYDGTSYFNVHVHKYISDYPDCDKHGTLEIVNNIDSANNIIGDDKWVIKDSDNSSIENEWLSHSSELYPWVDNITWLGGQQPYHNNAGSIANGEIKNLDWLFSQNKQNNEYPFDKYPSGDHEYIYLYDVDALKYYEAFHDNFIYDLDERLDYNDGLSACQINGKDSQSKIIINGKEYYIKIEDTNFVWDKGGDNEKYFYRRYNDEVNKHTYYYYKHYKYQEGIVPDLEMYHHIDDTNNFYVIWEGSISDIEHRFIISLNNNDYSNLTRKETKYEVPPSSDNINRRKEREHYFNIDIPDVISQFGYCLYHMKSQWEEWSSYYHLFLEEDIIILASYTNEGFHLSKWEINDSTIYSDEGEVLRFYSDDFICSYIGGFKAESNSLEYEPWELIDDRIANISYDERREYVRKAGLDFSYQDIRIKLKFEAIEDYTVNKYNALAVDSNDRNVFQLKFNTFDNDVTVEYEATRITIGNKDYIIIELEDGRMGWDVCGKHIHFFDCIDGQEEKYEYIEDNFNKIIVTWKRRGSHYFSVEVVNIYKIITDYINNIQKINSKIEESNINISDLFDSSNELSNYDVNDINFENGIISSFQENVQYSDYSESELISYVNKLQHYVVDTYNDDINSFLNDNGIKVKIYFAELSKKAGFSIDINNIEGDIS